MKKKTKMGRPKLKLPTRKVQLRWQLHRAEWIENNRDFINARADQLQEMKRYFDSDEAKEMRGARAAFQESIDEARARIK